MMNRLGLALVLLGLQPAACSAEFYPPTRFPDASGWGRQVQRPMRLLATSRSVHGPWKRLDQPFLEPRPGEWESLATTNPSLCPLPDGSFTFLRGKRMGWKSRRHRVHILAVKAHRLPEATKHVPDWLGFGRL